MSFDYRRIISREFADVISTYTKRDVMLYGLGLGFGFNPTDVRELRYVYEKNLEAFPTMALVVGHPGPWMTDPDMSIDMTKVLHAEQHLYIHRALPIEGSVLARNRVSDVIDKGASKGALIILERLLYDGTNGELLCTQRSVAIARGNGGLGGSGNQADPPHAIPNRSPDMVVEMKTAKQAGLLYRLSGDYNPIHADPDVARAAGFKAPILHGLASFGMTARAVLQESGAAACNLRSIGMRFSAPVYPGETIFVELWRTGKVISFRGRVLNRDVVVVNNGRAIIENC